MIENENETSYDVAGDKNGYEISTLVLKMDPTWWERKHGYRFNII